MFGSCCHICHVKSPCKYLITCVLCQMLNMTATKNKTKLHIFEGASSKTKWNKRVSLSERCRRSRCVARGCLHLSERKKKQPAIQVKKETEVSQRLTNSVLQMYHQLILEQRSQIFALLQKKTARKDIADIVGIKQCVQTFLQHIQELWVSTFPMLHL